jgi:hypothetical protein
MSRTGWTRFQGSSNGSRRRLPLTGATCRDGSPVRGRNPRALRGWTCCSAPARHNAGFATSEVLRAGNAGANRPYGRMSTARSPVSTSHAPTRLRERGARAAALCREAEGILREQPERAKALAARSRRGARMSGSAALWARSQFLMTNSASRLCDYASAAATAHKARVLSRRLSDTTPESICISPAIWRSCRHRPHARSGACWSS